MAERKFRFVAQSDFKSVFNDLAELQKQLGRLGGKAIGADQLTSGLQALEDQLKRLKTQLQEAYGFKLQEPGDLRKNIGDLRDAGKELGPTYREAAAELGRLLELLKTVDAQQQTRGLGRTGQEVLKRDVFPTSGSTDLATREDILRRITTITKGLNQETINTSKGVGKVNEATAEARAEAARLKLEWEGIAKTQLARTTKFGQDDSGRGGSTLAGREIVGQFQAQLESRIETLAQLQASLEQAVYSQPVGDAGLKLLNTLRAQQRQVESLTATLNRLREARAEAVKSAPTDEEGGEEARLQNIKQLTDDIVSTQQRLINAEEKLKQTQASSESLERASGYREILQRVREELTRVTQISAAFLDDADLSRELGPSYEKAIQNVNRLSRAYLEGNLNARQQKETIDQLAVATQKLSQIGDKVLGEKVRPADETIAAGRGIGAPQLGRIGSSIFGIADNFSRRFIQTFQFAFSAALQFGAVNAAKKFVEIALDAERAFQDIATNLEFDIEAGTGTAAFNSELERVRQQVNNVANDLNTLPEVVSRSAFVMVARFQSVERAMLALNAQVLAVQVSGISQEETLTALTAVAEAFAGSVFETNNALSLQEKLLQREQQSVLLYGKALDYAVRIQQTFGVSVENSLEGVARAGETFKLLGFSVEDTFAIVDSVVRKLGLPGQQVAERLNRSIGQLTSPEIRNQLLELARNSEALNLTLLDFENGKVALEQITRQFRNLEQVDPTTAQQVLQTIGQRREAEVVAAVLDTGDLQDQIRRELAGAADAARERFDILKLTVRETLESVNANIQTLAQNLERLGTLTPLKVLINGFDGLLTVLNNVLEGIISFKNTINEIGDFGLADIILNLTALLGALGIAGKGLAGLGALGKGRFAVAGFSTKESAAALPGLGSFLASGLGKLFPARNLSDFSRIVAEAGAETRGFASVVTKGGAAFRALLGPIGLFLSLIGIGVSIANGLKAADEQIALLKNDLADNRRAIRQEIQSGATTPEEGALRLAIQDLDRSKATPEVGTLSRIWEEFARDAGLSKGLGAIDIEIPDGIKNFFTDFFDSISIDTSLEHGLIPISESAQQIIDEAKGEAKTRQEQIDAEIQRQIDLLLGAAPDAFAVMFSAIQDLDVTQTSGRGAALLGGDTSRTQVLQQEFNALMAELASGDVTDIRMDEIAAQIAFLYSELRTEVELARDAFFAEGTPDQIAAEAKKTLRLFELGAIGFSEATELISANLEEIDKILAETEGNPNLLDEGQKDARLDAINTLQSLVAAQLQRETEVFAQLQSPSAQASGNIQALQNAIRQVEANFSVERTEELRTLYAQLAIAQEQRQDALLERAVTIAQGELSLARTDREYFAAVNKVIQAMESQQREAQADFASAIARATGSIIPDFAGIVRAIEEFEFISQAIQQAQDEIKKAADERAFQSQVAFAGASVLLGFKVRDPLAQIESELAEVYAERARAFENEAAALQNQQRERELLTDRAELALNAWKANNLLIAGVADNLNTLRAQITNQTQQLEFLATTVGKNSAEFAEAELALQNLNLELIRAEINYDRLGNLLTLQDPTSAFQQAQAALDAINAELEAIRLVGGGEEIRQTEVERQQAEISKIDAFYSSALAQAEFDKEFGNATEGQYISFLTTLRDRVDVTTEQGRALWLQINGLLEGMSEDVTDMAFNIPGEIRLPTLFEVRRSLAADQLGVNYQDNRQQNITLEVTNEVDLARVLSSIESAFGSNVEIESSRLSSGGSLLTIGGLS